MKEFRIYLNSGEVISLTAKGIRWYVDFDAEGNKFNKQTALDMAFVTDDPSDDFCEIVVAEFNSEHIAGYTVKEL